MGVMRNRWSFVLLALALPYAAAAASQRVVTLGDSLTFAYEAEFGFKKTIIPFGTFGDGMPASVRNWIEILSSPSHRGDSFDLGLRDSLTVSPPFGSPFELFFRQKRNWAIPGLKVDGMRRFVQGQASLLELMSESEDFATIGTLLSMSDFNPQTDFALSDFENQIRNEGDRVVVFIGGNDVRGIYGTVYDGGDAGTFNADFVADLNAVLDRIQTLKPGIPIVLTNVPHIGITPDIRELHPYDPMKTGRVTALLQSLNSQLKAVATARGIGYADVFTSTLRLLNPANPLILHGITFTNGSTATGDASLVWLNGPISANFHPNTNAQTVIANVIVHAFNDRYTAGIAPLSPTETLTGLLGKTAAQIDMPISSWLNAYGLTGSPSDDSEGDGLPNAIEFAAGLDPTLNDATQIRTTLSSLNLELAFPQRLASSPHFTLLAQSATTPGGQWSTVSPVLGTDGLLRASIPIGPAPGFLRLKATTP
jgi:hypothetical protein